MGSEPGGPTGGGPLAGVRVLELGGAGGVVYAGMLLADLGADVVRIMRAGGYPTDPVHLRGRTLLDLDLRTDDGRVAATRLLATADAALEGYRPGVAERLGVGPDDALAVNGRLVYVRMTGWGREGPLAQTVGHDVNYIALSSALAAIRRPPDRPLFPLALIGDYGGAGMLLTIGLLAALHEAQRSGRGQVVDTSILQGAATLMAGFWGTRAVGQWPEEPGGNLVDTGAPFYEVYECADGRFVTVGAVEPQFYAELCSRLGLGPEWTDQMDRAQWPARKRELEDLFRTRTQQEWCALLEGTDACFAPVLGWEDAVRHPQNVACGTFVTVDGVTQPAPAPRFSRTPLSTRPPERGDGVDAVLDRWRG